jgi:hypothetical protein
LFESAFVSDIEVDVVIDADTVWCCCRVAVGVEDALVECVAKGPFESWPFLPAE